jgi:outer membrane murein-binding lipoprotein Lpp
MAAIAMPMIITIPIFAINSSESSMSLIDRAASVHRWMLVGYIVALLLTVAFTYLVWSSGNRVQEAIRADANNRLESVRSDGQTAARESSEKIAGLNAEAEKLRLETEVARRDIAAAHSDAAKANERAGKLEITAGVQRQRAAEAEARLRELEQATATRHVSPEQAATLAALLKGSPVMSIAVSYQIVDTEAGTFAGEIVEALRGAKWDATLVVLAGHTTHRGLFINVGSRELPDTAAPVRLYKAFSAVGLQSKIGYLETLAANAMEIFVASK